MAKRKRKPLIPKTLLIICIITGIATLVLRMLNRRLMVMELGELTNYIGAAFAITLIIIIGIWVVHIVNKK